MKIELIILESLTAISRVFVINPFTNERSDEDLEADVKCVYFLLRLRETTKPSTK